MNEKDEALEAAWLDPEDVVEVEDEAPRVSDIRALRPRDAAQEAAQEEAPSPERVRSRSESRSYTFAAITRLMLFFMLGLGLGSIFALAVATVLDLRDTPRAKPAAAEAPQAPAAPAEQAAPPAVGEPGPAL